MKCLSRICRIKNNRPTGKSTSAFTLVEMMVVATIFSFVAAGIALSFISGIKLWSRARNADFAKYQFLVEFESVARDLRQSIDEPVIGFEGNATEIIFPELSGDSIFKVAYSFDAIQPALVKKKVEMKQLVAGKEAEGAIEERFPGWEGFSLNYLYYDEENEGFIWASEWLKEKGIFAALKIDAVFKGEKYTKIIFIHTA